MARVQKPKASILEGIGIKMYGISAQSIDRHGRFHATIVLRSLTDLAAVVLHPDEIDHARHVLRSVLMSDRGIQTLKAVE